MMEQNKKWRKKEVEEEKIISRVMLRRKIFWGIKTDLIDGKQ